MSQICFTTAISWLLAFNGVPNDRGYGVSCFTEKWLCEVAALGANRAFQIDRMSPLREAVCVEQPPYWGKSRL